MEAVVSVAMMLFGLIFIVFRRRMATVVLSRVSYTEDRLTSTTQFLVGGIMLFIVGFVGFVF